MPTVLDALCTGAFRGAQILAGWGGLGRQVRATTVCEVPDAADWLRGGEVALSTCHYFHADPAGLVRWVQGLEACGAAALAVKPGRFLGQVPASVQELAERLAFPLIVLPMAATWPPLIHAISQLIDNEPPAQAVPSWRDDVRMVLQDGLGLPTLCEVVAYHTGCAAVLYDGAGRVQAAALPDRSDPRFEAVLAYRLGGDPPAMPPEGAGQAATWREVWAPPGQDTFLEHVYPVVSSGTLQNTISLLVPLPADEAPPADFMAYIVAVLSLAHHRLDRGLGEERARRRLYLRRLLLGGAGDPAAQRRLTSYVASPGGVMVIAVRDVPDGDLAEAAQLVHETFSADDPMALATEVQGRFVALVHADGRSSLRQACGRLLGRVAGRLQQRWPGAAVAAGVGSLAHGPEAFARSFEEALRALEVALDEGSDHPAFYEDVGFYGALLGDGDRAQVRRLAREVLLPLHQWDRKHDSQLVESLRVYFASDCNIEQTAKHLFIHPNTLRYRLKQVEQLTGLNLNRFEARAKLWLAMKIDRGPGS